jgi:hypothetical protein
MPGHEWILDIHDVIIVRRAHQNAFGVVHRRAILEREALQFVDMRINSNVHD